MGRHSAVFSFVRILWVLEVEHGSLQATSAECVDKGRATLWHIEKSALFNLPVIFLLSETQRLRTSASQEVRGQG